MNAIRLGRMFVFRTPYIFGPRYIINFPIRDGKWKTRIQDIEVGLRDLVNQVNRLGIQSIAMPPLGCETKGLHWVDVRVRIEKVFGPLREVRTLLFAPVQTFGTIPCGSEVNESEPCP